MKETLMNDDDDQIRHRNNQGEREVNSWELLDHPLKTIGMDQLEVGHINIITMTACMV